MNAVRLAYLVSVYPAVSHTFILREIMRLRELGLEIVTASVNPPDRAREVMDDCERGEADRTYCLKTDGMRGALRALGYWGRRSPRQLLAAFRLGLAMGAGKRRWIGLAYAVEAAMVARWMKQQSSRHLHVHFGNAGASVGVLVKVLNGCHLSYTIHGPDEFDDVPGQQLALKMQKADAVVCISQFARGQLMRISVPEHWPKLRLCRLGVDPDRFRFALRSGRHRPVTQLLCVGRLTPAKCQVLLVQACARLRDAGLAFHLTLVGAGPDLERIRQAIARERLEAHVTLTGALTQQAVRDQLDRADIFVLPSLAEGIPVVLMEAMASGVPCVSTPVNGIPELIRHGQTGLLALPGDVDSLVEQLERLVREPVLRDTLALAARDKLLADFDLSRNVTQLAQIFRAFPARADLEKPAGP
ncbi:glycosyltransferase family 4 protein [Laribacter hongkongensis]|uniref:glycosyltransferase family 4 protein n=1 Tax=Laribacter hongkongensis TaxID=168471 RepID=UPI001EFD8A2B|nr:glycosyltransferase family 4 protein [Laribacter hongkongensis]MCG9063478.1 glycosyltransferase family 4 protein [Laribacter hongkongensis]